MRPRPHAAAPFSPATARSQALHLEQLEAQLSALLDAVQAGEDVEITRRGVPVALLTRAAERPAADFDLQAFLAATTNQPLHQGSDGATVLEELREGARY